MEDSDDDVDSVESDSIVGMDEDDVEPDSENSSDNQSNASDESGDSEVDSDDNDGSDGENGQSDDSSVSDTRQKTSLVPEPITDDLDKAKAVTAQLRLWEHLLKMRVSLQKALVIINQLPQCEKLNNMVAEIDESGQKAASSGRSNLKNLLDQLFHLETLLLLRNPDTKSLVDDNSKSTANKVTENGSKDTQDDDDEEITSESEAGSDNDNTEDNSETQLSRKRKTKLSEYPQTLAKRHKAFESYRNSTIQKWADKTQMLSKFSAFDQSVTKQIEQAVSDKVRLVMRTKINRLGNRVLGKEIPDSSQTQETVTVQQDDEIFDDNDFYHHILREFIQYKNSYDPIVLTKQWLEIQQYRKKAKKNVDRKASKGRKTRFNVHKPLINFMAPFHSPDLWTNEQRDDLYKNLFGRSRGGELS